MAVLFRIIARRWMTKGATVQTSTLSTCGHLSYKGGKGRADQSFRIDGRFFQTAAWGIFVRDCDSTWHSNKKGAGIIRCDSILMKLGVFCENLRKSNRYLTYFHSNMDFFGYSWDNK